MAEDPLAQLNVIGQKALSVPTDILNVGTKRITEDVSMMTAKVQELGVALTPPPGGFALPGLPPLPGMPGAAETPAPGETRSEAVRGTKTVRKTSYLRV